VLDVESARDIAQRALEVAQKSRALRLIDEPVDRPSHWVFRYNAVEYFETDDDRLAVIGMGPIAVAKEDGAILWLNGREPIDKQV
jgi:Immunity protein 35